MSERTNKTLLGSSVLLAITSSLCCIAPVLTILGGVSGAASAFSWVAPLRPYIIGLTVLVLGYSFYNVYKKTTEAEDCCAPKRKRFMQSKNFLWTITIVSALLITFPYYSGLFYKQETSSAQNVNVENLESITLKVEGMSCKECENHVNSSALQQPGVVEANTLYEKGVAEIKFDRTISSADKIAASIENETGYKITPQ